MSEPTTSAGRFLLAYLDGWKSSIPHEAHATHVSDIEVEAAREASTAALGPVIELLELAWGVIANAGGGDWTRESSEWQEAAARWRDRLLHEPCEDHWRLRGARTGLPMTLHGIDARGALAEARTAALVRSAEKHQPERYDNGKSYESYQEWIGCSCGWNAEGRASLDAWWGHVIDAEAADGTGGGTEG